MSKKSRIRRLVITLIVVIIITFFVIIAMLLSEGSDKAVPIMSPTFGPVALGITPPPMVLSRPPKSALVCEDIMNESGIVPVGVRCTPMAMISPSPTFDWSSVGLPSG